MAVKTKKAVVSKKPVKAKVVVAAKVLTEDSPAKKELLAFIENLKVENPTAYQKNAINFEKQLNQL